ncbi:MAG: 50S ribosome-binding GTPase, partial [Proteobacteria bacterium]|nr:50S ribosome-binding GTPase [Pseudomonadota bacterium]
MPATVAILGRPNVGKSTLFNRLAGRRLALVHDTPGVTRDWKVVRASFGNLKFDLVDTAGLIEDGKTSLTTRMKRSTEAVLREKADMPL